MQRLERLEGTEISEFSTSFHRLYIETELMQAEAVRSGNGGTLMDPSLATEPAANSPMTTCSLPITPLMTWASISGIATRGLDGALHQGPQNLTNKL